MLEREPGMYDSDGNKIDIPLMVERLLGTGIKYRMSNTYENLKDTWGEDPEVTPCPTGPEIRDEWNTYMSLSNMKARKIQQVKEKAYNLLKETDWYIVRESETGEAIPQDVLDERQSIRDQSNQMETEINNLTAKDEVENYEIVYS